MKCWVCSACGRFCPYSAGTNFRPDNECICYVPVFKHDSDEAGTLRVSHPAGLVSPTSGSGEKP